MCGERTSEVDGINSGALSFLGPAHDLLSVDLNVIYMLDKEWLKQGLWEKGPGISIWEFPMWSLCEDNIENSPKTAGVPWDSESVKGTEGPHWSHSSYWRLVIFLCSSALTIASDPFSLNYTTLCPHSLSSHEFPIQYKSCALAGNMIKVCLYRGRLFTDGRKY